LASDHGHVWHRPDARLASGDSGTRWRSQSGNVEQGEIAITGKRVRDEGDQDSVISAWSETLYYLKQQNGYHGGVTPQEMICPLVILTDKTSTYSGLFPCEYPKPEWWSSAPVASAMEPEPVVPVVVVGPKRPASLFDHLKDDDPKERTEKKPATAAKPQATAAWVDRLLGSQAYKDQKDFVRRHAPDDDTVRRCLVALDSSGGILTPVAFCKVTDIPAGRLDGLMARIQRLLNVDGYEVLVFSRAENRIELNVAKLKRQFDLE
jgi:hypothetical protein